ncbi:MAG: 30S ribosomal protein S6 [Mycoplasmataceae bacterium]|jgi:small subunit ribosomal protein S6|nr:30S ribosomal protein S6 [Mycoplasmataceae bacterium]
MVKYEIDLLVNGSLKESEALKNISNLINLISKEKNYELDKTTLGKRELAYQIKKETSAYYFIFTFETSDASIIKEFNRLALLNDSVLRILINNLEKAYGYKASTNKDKIEKAKVTRARYEKDKALYGKPKIKNDEIEIGLTTDVETSDIENE